MPRVAAVPLGVLMGLPIAACFMKPPAPEATVDGASSTGSDALIGDARADVAAGTCAFHDFSGAVATGCGSWVATELGQTVAGGGSLLLTVPGTGSAGSASCVATQGFTQATLNITSFTPVTSFDKLRLFFLADGIKYGALVHRPVASANLAVECNGAWPVAGPTANLLRLVWAPPTLTVQYASTAASGFFDLGTCTIAPPESLAIGVEVERGSGGSALEANLDSVEICE